MVGLIMMPHSLPRRGFLTLAAAAAITAKPKRVPVGVELYSVRDQLKQDLMGTVRQVAKIGYEGVEFYAPYFEWTAAYAKEVRQLLDDTGMKCFSTHTSAKSYAPENIGKAIELNQILGSRFAIMSSAGGRIADLDGWKVVAERLNQGAEKMKPAGMRAGFHNHAAEFKPIGGTRPMDVLARHTGKDVVLQLDVGTCVEAGSDPVEWIRRNAGRIVSAHLKDWAPGGADKGYQVLFGEGVVPWKKVFDECEKSGGIEYYLIEQEGSRFEPLETIGRCLATYRKMRGA